MPKQDTDKYMDEIDDDVYEDSLEVLKKSSAELGNILIRKFK